MKLAVRYGAITANPAREVDSIEAKPKNPPRALTGHEVSLACKSLAADERAVEADLPDLVTFILGTNSTTKHDLPAQVSDATGQVECDKLACSHVLRETTATALGQAGHTARRIADQLGQARFPSPRSSTSAAAPRTEPPPVRWNMRSTTPICSEARRRTAVSRRAAAEPKSDRLTQHLLTRFAPRPVDGRGLRLELFLAAFAAGIIVATFGPAQRAGPSPLSPWSSRAHSPSLSPSSAPASAHANNSPPCGSVPRDSPRSSTACSSSSPASRRRRGLPSGRPHPRQFHPGPLLHRHRRGPILRKRRPHPHQLTGGRHTATYRSDRWMA